MMKFFARAAAAGLVLVAGMASAYAAAPSIVNVTLWDMGASADIATNRGIGGGGDMSKATMGVRLSTKSVPAGEVTFKVVNSSPDTIHEMVVFPYKDAEKIPFSDKDAKINEDMAGHLGEVSELDPTKGGAVTLTLKPGKYLLTCNIPGHYMNGMWTILTVK